MSIHLKPSWIAIYLICIRGFGCVFYVCCAMLCMQVFTHGFLSKLTSRSASQSMGKRTVIALVLIKIVSQSQIDCPFDHKIVSIAWIKHLLKYYINYKLMHRLSAAQHTHKTWKLTAIQNWLQAKVQFFITFSPTDFSIMTSP